MATMRLILRSLLVALAGLLPLPPLFAQGLDCSEVELDVETPDAAQMALDRLFHEGCLGSTRCTSELLGEELQSDESGLCTAVAAWEETYRDDEQKGDDGEHVSPSNREEQVRTAGLLIVQIASHLSDMAIAEPNLKRVQQSFLTEMEEVIQSRSYASTDVQAARWNMQLQTMFSGPTRVDVIGTLRAECEVAESCQEALEALARIFSHGSLISRIHIGLLRAYREETLAFLENMNARWKYFRESSRAMFPWEIWLNDRSYEIQPFGGPPSRQWVLLHPGPGYELSDEYDDAQFFETAVLEVAGFYRWGWKESGDLKHPWGASLVATWRDHPGDEPLGAGLLVHTPVENMSLGTTWREGPSGDEWSVLLNVDLAKWLLGEGKFQTRIREEIFGLE